MSVGHVYLLDSEGLSQWVRGDRRMGLRLKDADRSDIPVVTTSMTLVEAYHSKLHRPAWRWPAGAPCTSTAPGPGRP